MKIVKGPSGFGDAIYTRVIIEWLLKNRPDNYKVYTTYPDVFADLSIETEDFTKRRDIDYHLTYIERKTEATTQFQDMLIKGNLPLIPLNSQLKNRNPSNITVVHLPYNPMGNCSNSLPMKPNFPEFINFTNQFDNIKYIAKQYPFRELIDIYNSANLVIGQVGWSLPLAEMLDVPIISILTHRALNSSNTFISAIKPHKLITKSTTQIKIME